MEALIKRKLGRNSPFPFGGGGGCNWSGRYFMYISTVGFRLSSGGHVIFYHLIDAPCVSPAWVLALQQSLSKGSQEAHSRSHTVELIFGCQPVSDHSSSIVAFCMYWTQSRAGHLNMD